MRRPRVGAALALALATLGSGASLGEGAAAGEWAVAVLPSGAEFSLEVAADADARALGYMFRETVGAREGMLFVFESPGRYGFWMKNCRVRLDIVWLDRGFRVVDLASDLPPCRPGRDCPEVRPLVPATYVLEFAGGTARAQGLKRGDRIDVLWEQPIP